MLVDDVKRLDPGPFGAAACEVGSKISKREHDRIDCAAFC